MTCTIIDPVAMVMDVYILMILVLKDTQLYFVPWSNCDVQHLCVVYSVTPVVYRMTPCFIATHGVPTCDLYHTTSRCRLGYTCVGNHIDITNMAFVNPLPSTVTEGYGVLRHLCWALAHAQATQRFDWAVPCLLAELLLEKQMSSRGYSFCGIAIFSNTAPSLSYLYMEHK